MKVHVWNVGHGEAIRIDVSDDRTVIRDFGRSRNARPTRTSIAERGIIDQGIIPAGRKVDAILSHAHEDHYNGFRQLRDDGVGVVFVNSYIPALDFSTAESIGMQLTVLSAFLYAYTPSDRIAHRQAGNWFRAAPVMASLSRRLLGVSAGHTFPWATPGRVLWPPPPEQLADFHKHALKRVRRAVNWFSSDSGLVNSDGASFIRSVAENLGGTLRRYHSGECPTGQATSEDLGAIEGMLEELAQWPRGQFPSRESLEGCWRSYKDAIDDHSICFRLGNRALFLSDLHPKAINSMCHTYHRAPEAYGLLKSSHHGTRFGEGLRRAVKTVDHLLHTCGPAHKSYGGPTMDYERLWSRHTDCTDWNHGAKNWRPIPAHYELFAGRQRTYSI